MVNAVELAADTYLVCLNHALSTEKEEIMGLLLGEVLSCACNRVQPLLNAHTSTIGSREFYSTIYASTHN